MGNGLQTGIQRSDDTMDHLNTLIVHQRPKNNQVARHESKCSGDVWENQFTVE